MSLNDFSTENRVVVVNGRQITDWGEAASPFTNAPIDPKRQLRRGQGGGAVQLTRKNPGRAVNLFLNPGSPDSAYMQGLLNSGAVITLVDTQIRTLEVNTGTQGVMVTDGSQDRAGSTISDDLYTIHFNGWIASKGGE